MLVMKLGAILFKKIKLANAVPFSLRSMKRSD